MSDMTILNLKQKLVLADKHGDPNIRIKMENLLSKCIDNYQKRYFVSTVVSNCFTYADNRKLFKVMTEFCLSNLDRHTVNFKSAIEFHQQIGYSPERLREDDVTEFLFELYNKDLVIVRDHLHFFSDEYQMFIDL